MVTVAIIDDDDGLRRAVCALLDSPQRTTRSFATGEDFLEALPGEKFDAAILDLRLPGMSGLRVLESLMPLPFPVVMMSADGDIQSAVQAVKLGASDFIEKPFTPDALESVLETALRKGDSKAASPVSSRPPAGFHDLTPREREVALALNEGLSNKEVARELGCSPRTVEVHRSRIFSKLGVSNIAGLIRTISGQPS